MTTLADDSVVYELQAHMRLLPNPRCDCLKCRAAGEIGDLYRRVQHLEDLLADSGAAGKEITRLETLVEFQQRYIVELTDRINEARRNSDGQRVRRYRRLLTPAFLSEVADVYRENVLTGPTQAVAEHFHTSRQNAGKWVKHAREAGILEEVLR